jgi:hypothetical protein
LKNEIKRTVDFWTDFVETAGVLKSASN